MTLARLGKYEIVAKIGQGGMGEVYRAHDPILGRDVAIKTMLSEPGVEQEELRKRFIREAQSAARLNHPNIVTVHDFGEDQGRMYIAMELLEGADLKEVIFGPQLSVEAQLNLMDQVCDGLAFAHSKDVIHRDLKPANIHVSPTRQVKIMDFGLARVSSSNVTRAGMILGTPNYMAPEQVKAEKVTARSDVFALGAVFYELLSGRKSFDAESLAGVLYQVMQSQPEPLEQVRPEAPRALCEVVRRAMEKEPSRRYADAAELREALRQARRSMGPVTMAGVSGPLVASDSPAHPGKIAPATLTRPTPVGGAPPPRDALAREFQADTLQAEAHDATRAAPSAGPPTVAEPTTVRPSSPPQPPTVAVRETRPSSPGPRPTTSGRRVVPAPQRRNRSRLLATGIGAVLCLVAVGWWLTRDRASTAVGPGTSTPQPVTSTLTAPPPPTSVAGPSGAERARRALEERDYRRAVSLAESALRSDSTSTSARDTLDRARQALREGDQAASEVRRGIERRDSEAASRALTGLVAMDPGYPDIPSLTNALNGLLRAQAEELRRAHERPRPTPAPPRPAPATVPPSLAPATTLPAPRPPVTTPPPVTAPPATQPPPPSPETAIRKTLAQYREACHRLDPVAIRHLFPLIKDDALKVFAKMERYEVTFEDVEVHVEGDRHATVECVATYEATPKNSSRVASRSQMRQTIRLEKVDNAWVIRAIE
jgi:eukaryotic-like serine/threonine-protein kinase